jgi:hypothetical protein
MKRVNPLFILTLVSAWISFCGVASAQDCGQISQDEGDITCCDGTETQQDHHCGGSGDPSDFCSEGYGNCCGTDYQTTNVTYDPDQCGGGCSEAEMKSGTASPTA